MHFLSFLSTAVILLPGLMALLTNPIKELYFFENHTFVENLAIRPNGELLITTFGPGELYALDPRCVHPTPRSVFQFQHNSSTGIAQLAPDQWAVVSGDVDPAKARFVNGTAAVSILEFNSTKDQASLIKVIQAPADAMVNGLAILPESPGCFLAADSSLGRILRFDSEAGVVEVVLQDVLLAPFEGAIWNLGVNGIKVFGGHLYYTNSARETIGRIPMTPDGRRFGKFEKLAVLEVTSTDNGWDDFDVDMFGSLYVSRHLISVLKLDQDGRQQVLVNDTLLMNPTSVVLSQDHKSMYITTVGGQVLEAYL